MDNIFIFKDAENTHLLKYCGNADEVTIPEGVTIIGEAAFASCFNLNKVILPNTLKEIKKLAFYNCINLEITPSLDCEIADDAFLGCVKLKKDKFELREMTIKQIETETIATFYVKDYQRGYRWTKNEIEELLNDIKETGSRYCVQPLIVKLCEPKSCKRYIDKTGIHDTDEDLPIVAYELVDGQQRLTTMLLILNECCARQSGSSPVNYRIYYELLREIDDHYILKAKSIISEWLNSKSTELDLEEFISKIREKLFFIWYEMKKQDNIIVEDEFRNINDGQTPLTNAELFKALLLNPENAFVYPDGHREDIKAKLFEMAFQWDDMEQNLRNCDFWFFIANDECQERTHLDYLFELFAISLESMRAGRGLNGKPKINFDNFQSNIEKLDKNRDRYSFLAVKYYVEYLDCSKNDNKRFESVQQVWKEIVEQYNHLYSWYSDLELYHTIGYLIAIEKSKSGNSIVPSIVIDLFNKHISSDLTEIKLYVRKKICDYLKDQIIEDGKNLTIFSPNYYERNKKDIRDFLLFINVWSTFNAREKFPFFKFKNTKHSKTNKTINWDIEHVSARNLKEKISEEDLEKIKPWWKSEDKSDNDQGERENRKWDKNEWKRFAKRVNEEEPDNSISNLVLLDSNTNRSYGDALFFGKRKEIIDRDKESAYIPICTKNVFLKYYTEDPDFSVAWSEKDKEGYFATILTCVKDGIFNESDIPKALKLKIDEIIRSYSIEEDEI